MVRAADVGATGEVVRRANILSLSLSRFHPKIFTILQAVTQLLLLLLLLLPRRCWGGTTENDSEQKQFVLTVK
jgi:hypothetical protein